jgi:hypothetical protein
VNINGAEEVKATMFFLGHRLMNGLRHTNLYRGKSKYYCGAQAFGRD